MTNCISGAIRLFGSLLYIPAIRYFSRRGLLCISSFLMGISLILLGLAVYSHHSKDSALRHDPTYFVLKGSEMAPFAERLSHSF